MCTSIMVGRKASMNNTTLIGRNEDFHEAINPKRLEYVNKLPRIFKSVYTGVEIELEEKSFSFSSIPDSVSETYNNGRFSEASINEIGVAISATESLYSNDRVLRYDPYVEKGIAEDAIVDIVIPFVKNAKEGVLRLGHLIEKYGSREGNGVIFSDKKEIWYMEILTGHHYVAQRIPDDSYAIASNTVCIQEVNFTDSNFIFSKGFKDFIISNKLNPYKTINIRKIFGTNNLFDNTYNWPRMVHTHKYFDENYDENYENKDVPFINKINRLIYEDDLMEILSSHYNGTKYNPMEFENKYRPISLTRTQESHVIELGKTIDIKWLSFGTPTFTPYIPIFTRVSKFPESYTNTTFDLNLDNAYWLFKMISYYLDTHYHLLKKENEKYLINIKNYSKLHIENVDKYIKSNKLDNLELVNYLELKNEEIVNYAINESKKFLEIIIKRSMSVSKLSFKLDKNL